MSFTDPTGAEGDDCDPLFDPFCDPCFLNPLLCFPPPPPPGGGGGGGGGGGERPRTFPWPLLPQGFFADLKPVTECAFHRADCAVSCGAVVAAPCAAGCEAAFPLTPLPWMKAAKVACFVTCGGIAAFCYWECMDQWFPQCKNGDLE